MLTHHQTMNALGSSITLLLVSDADDARVNDIFRQLWLQLLLFEKRCSRFLPNSELTQFNQAAGVKRSVSPEFRDILLAAKRLAEVTDGLYNPFILPALQRAGYDASLVQTYKDDPVDDYSDRSVADAAQLEVGDTWARIPYGTAIDLGGCGKGYAGDMLADAVAEFSEVTGYWFSIGGDVATGGLDEQGNPWVVHVEATRGKGKMAGRVVMPDGSRAAVATSSVAVRKGAADGKRWHHIIDPRTLKPSVSDVVTATVYAKTLIEADVLASCLIIVGSEQAERYLALHERQVYGGLLQCGGGTGRLCVKQFGSHIDT